MCGLLDSRPNAGRCFDPSVRRVHGHRGLIVCGREASYTGFYTGGEPLCPSHYQKVNYPTQWVVCPDCGGEKMESAVRCRACWAKFTTGENHPTWKGGGRWLSYGLTEAEYFAEVNKQNNLCDMCDLPEPLLNGSGDHRPLSVDHDHTHCPAGRACDECRRGLACSECNHIIGFANDSVTRLGQGIMYLVKWDRTDTRMKEAIAVAREILDRYES